MDPSAHADGSDSIALHEWLAGQIDDREAVTRMAAAFARLGDLWVKGSEDAQGGK